MKRLGLITNPSAGNGFGKLAGQVAVAQLQRECEVLDITGETKAQSEANSQEAINQGLLDGLVVVGGDGAVQQGVNLCVAADIPLGIIAAGTGNDAARTLGLPIRDAVAGAGVLLNNIQKPRVVDVVRAKTSTRELYFFGSTNADFGALVNMRANS
ncbi:MAG: sphingosine kinase, partial [Actinobacteria bacterium]|nr:sphingosine kinase [Actinomycetota bacterium]